MADSIQAKGAVPVSMVLFHRLQMLAAEQQRSVSELVEQAVELQFGQSAVPEPGPTPGESELSEARLRLIDRLARLEAGLGDPEELHEQVRRESRRLREAKAHRAGT
jgi:hypothetical protein